MRGSHQHVRAGHSLGRTLAHLWSFLAGPVVSKLRELGISEQSRIWWCPTSVLTAFPIHAAGPVPGQEDKYLLDIFVSSYTPTLSALIAAREDVIHRPGSNHLQVLAIPGPRLSQASAEIDAVVQQLSNTIPVTNLGEQSTATEAVVGHLQTHPWVHFACHGHLSVGQPFESSLELEGIRLTLIDIVRARLSHAEFAYLAACHSAASDQQRDGTQEEVLHLAAAMQFCGFRSVLGTLWAMSDSDGPDLAREFYRQIVEKKGLTDETFRHSSRALCEAIKHLRRKDGMTLARWVTFVHIGA